MLKLGELQKLKVLRMKDFGAYLGEIDGNSDDGSAVLLPIKEVPKDLKPGDELLVFIYKDSWDRFIATCKKPLISVGEVGRVRVSDITSIGAFVEIGLPKQVLIPHREMRYTPNKGDEVEVYLYVDRSNRLAASMYTNKHLRAPHVGSKERKKYFYESDAERILDILKEKHGGKVDYSDKSALPEWILRDFGMSKAAFKRALGKLMKEGKVKVSERGIVLI